MQTDDHLVGERAGIAHLPQVLPEISLIERGGFTWNSDHESAAQEVVRIFGPLRHRVALGAPPLLASIPADRRADLAQFIEHRLFETVDDLVAQSVDARIAERVVALVASF